MTVCIAALADKGKTIVVFADKMIGMEAIQSEIANKILEIHRDWRVMFAGNDIDPVSDIVDAVEEKLLPRRKVSANDVIDAMVENFQFQRLRRAEALYLKPIGLTIQQFLKPGATSLPEAEWRHRALAIDKSKLDIDFLVAGFDSRGQGHIFTVTDPGYHQRWNIPGFAAIGIGAEGANYMMYWRNLRPEMALRRVIYHAFEAKWFGEEAPGVGERTDGLILKFQKSPVRLGEKTTIDKTLAHICNKNQPRKLDNEDIRQLNQISELSNTKEFSLLKEKGKKEKK